MAAEVPKVARDGTMEVTAKEGMAYLEKEKPDLAEKIKQQLKEDDANKAENGSGDAPATENSNGVAKLPRDNTMVQTAQEGRKFLEKEGGVNEDAKTRSQEKELNDSKSEEKEATKRSADETTDDTDEVKKQKVEDNGDKQEEEAAQEEEKKE